MTVDAPGTADAPVRPVAERAVTGVRLDLRRVSLAYGDREVLRDVDLVVRSGERVCLLGPNGAGKSSLLRCVTGTARDRRGEVLVDGVSIERLGRDALARRMAVVPGEIHLPFATRVEEVVGLGRVPHEHPLRGPRPEDARAVRAAMARVGLAHLRERDARELSMGERQLVVLAMAVAQGGGLLILDEPTMHLDLRHQVEVMQLLVDLNEREGITVLAVLHDLALAAHFFPRLVLLDHGRLVADGQPSDVLTPERIREVYRVDPRFAPTVVARAAAPTAPAAGTTPD